MPFCPHFVAYLSLKTPWTPQSSRFYLDVLREAKPTMFSGSLSTRTARVHTRRHTGAMPGDPARSFHAVPGSGPILGPDGRGPC